MLYFSMSVLIVCEMVMRFFIWERRLIGRKFSTLLLSSFLKTELPLRFATHKESPLLQTFISKGLRRFNMWSCWQYFCCPKFCFCADQSFLMISFVESLIVWSISLSSFFLANFLGINAEVSHNLLVKIDLHLFQIFRWFQFSF